VVETVFLFVAFMVEAFIAGYLHGKAKTYRELSKDMEKESRERLDGLLRRGGSR
jgi:hypothetical protein